MDLNYESKVQTQQSAPPDLHAARIELLISTLLRVGVTLSLSIVVIGTVVSFVHHPEYRTSTDELKRLTEPGAAFPHSLAAMARGIVSGSGESLVLLGLILLIATPIVRVAVSLLIFMHQRDRAFVYITCLVLALLMLSFFLGKAGG